MRRLPVLPVILPPALAAAILIPAAPALAAPLTASCQISPSPLEVNQQATVTAEGLPTTTPVYTYDDFTYDGRHEYYSPNTLITVNPDGTWSATFTWGSSGHLELVFDNADGSVVYAKCATVVK